LQPSLLALSFPDLAALGLPAEVRSLQVPVIRKKKFLAVQAPASVVVSFHGFQKLTEPVSENKKSSGRRSPKEEDSNQ
jgi:hypothetical protein